MCAIKNNAGICQIKLAVYNNHISFINMNLARYRKPTPKRQGTDLMRSSREQSLCDMQLASILNAPRS